MRIYCRYPWIIDDSLSSSASRVAIVTPVVRQGTIPLLRYIQRNLFLSLILINGLSLCDTNPPSEFIFEMPRIVIVRPIIAQSSKIEDSLIIFSQSNNNYMLIS